MKLLTLTRENGESQAFVVDHIVTFLPRAQGGTWVVTICESYLEALPWLVTENFMTVKRMMEDTK